MKKRIRIIGVPMDLGQKRRGVNMGPYAIRYAGIMEELTLLGYDVHDWGDVSVPVRDSISVERVNREIVLACERVYQASKEAVEKGCIPIFLGGDHSISIGSIGGVTHHGAVGLIWIDAHGDFNTPETSATGNVHGMPLAVTTGFGASELVHLGRQGFKVDPRHVVLIGVRCLDPEERRNLLESGVTIFTMRDVDEKGISTVARMALESLGQVERIHVSLDMDSLDPAEAPGVGTPVPGGLTFREAHLLMEIIADSSRCASMDIVEVNPIMDTSNRTSIIAVNLALSLFGKRIL